ncbi:MgtC/SapB family protein [Sphingomonas morindae]|uniref:Protein MgtC n=1 Tax=Sphingomonas morindae TaxID=1541170 RepID=A0ABY4X9F1_9SPHN|nr:MgtC/SapB family protein [Sphingomonas morindae]USI73574.1 MgtC/SapB family protein [Sphingomonas morindae]
MISNTDIAIRLLASALLGSLIGFERERLLWAAGVRTHMLVSVGSALLIIVSAYGFTNATQMPHVVLDPSRVAAQVVSGIGFLGAGSILLRGQAVKGLTTAASIWSVAAIGLASGAGLYFAAGLATAIILLILVGIKPLEEAYRARVQSAVVKVSAERAALDPEGIKKQLGLRGGQIRRMTAVPGDDDLDLVTLNLVKVSQRDIRMAAARLKDAPGVHEVTIGKVRKVRDGDGEPLS